MKDWSTVLFFLLFILIGLIMIIDSKEPDATLIGSVVILVLLVFYNVYQNLKKKK